MSEDEKKEKVQAIADVIKNLLQQVDIFSQVITKDDYSILEEVKETLKSRIQYKQSASVMFYAVGADADTTDEEMKLKTMNLLIELIKTRIEYREKMIELQKEKENKQNAIDLFKSMGMI